MDADGTENVNFALRAAVQKTLAALRKECEEYAEKYGAGAAPVFDYAEVMSELELLAEKFSHAQSMEEQMDTLMVMQANASQRCMLGDTTPGALHLLERAIDIIEDHYRFSLQPKAPFNGMAPQFDDPFYEVAKYRVFAREARGAFVQMLHRYQEARGIALPLVDTPEELASKIVYASFTPEELEHVSDEELEDFEADMRQEIIDGMFAPYKRVLREPLVPEYAWFIAEAVEIAVDEEVQERSQPMPHAAKALRVAEDRAAEHADMPHAGRFATAMAETANDNPVPQTMREDVIARMDDRGVLQRTNDILAMLMRNPQYRGLEENPALMLEAAGSFGHHTQGAARA